MFEPAGFVNEYFGVIIYHSTRDNLVDDQRLEIRSQVLHLNLFVMLGRKDNRFHPFGALSFILDRHLRLPIRSKIGHYLLPAYSTELPDQLMSQHDRHRHQLFCFPAGIAKHQSLISCSLFMGICLIDADGNVGRLLMDR